VAYEQNFGRNVSWDTSSYTPSMQACNAYFMALVNLEPVSLIREFHFRGLQLINLFAAQLPMPSVTQN
jgi:hypothetical protein